MNSSVPECTQVTDGTDFRKHTIPEECEVCEVVLERLEVQGVRVQVGYQPPLLPGHWGREGVKNVICGNVQNNQTPLREDTQKVS